MSYFSKNNVFDFVASFARLHKTLVFSFSLFLSKRHQGTTPQALYLSCVDMELN